MVDQGINKLSYDSALNLITTHPESVGLWEQATGDILQYCFVSLQSLCYTPRGRKVFAHAHDRQMT